MVNKLFEEPDLRHYVSRRTKSIITKI